MIDVAARDRTDRRPPVRVATPSDVSQLVRIINLAYRVEDFFINGNRTSAEDIRGKIAKPGAAFFVVDAPADASAGDAGSLAAAAYFEIRGDRGYFAMLSVDPAHQKQGLARRLIQHMENRSRAAGCRALEIEVVDLRAELPAFYQRFKFTPVGTAPFPDPHKLTQPAHLVLMVKEL
jgi:GNAT superfamily N-acetyltransferase